MFCLLPAVLRGEGFAQLQMRKIILSPEFFSVQNDKTPRLQGAAILIGEIKM